MDPEAGGDESYGVAVGDGDGGTGTGDGVHGNERAPNASVLLESEPALNQYHYNMNTEYQPGRALHHYSISLFVSSPESIVSFNANRSVPF
jgi:hypothetical protein